MNAMKIRFYAVAVAIWVLDHLTKSAARAWLLGGEAVEVIPGFFALSYVENTGVAFGLFADVRSPWKPDVLAALAVAAIAAIVAYSLRLPRDRVLVQAALAVTLGGIAGNFGDRVAYGYVVDAIADRGAVEGVTVKVTSVSGADAAARDVFTATATTDATGFFLIDGIPEGLVTLEFRGPQDYVALTETVDAAGVGQITCSMATYRQRHIARTPDPAKLPDDFVTLPDVLPPGQVIRLASMPGLEEFENFLSFVSTGKGGALRPDGSLRTSDEEGDVSVIAQYKGKKSSKKTKVKK